MEALKFAFQSEDAWSNVLIAFVFQLIPLIGPIALLGWHAEILQRLTKGHPRPIPKLDFADLSHYLNRGVPAFAVSILMALPIGIFMGMLFGIGGAVAGAISAATRAGSHARHGGPDPTVFLGMMAAFMVISAVSAPLLSVVGNGFTTRAELTEDIGLALDIGKGIDYLKRTFWAALLGFMLWGALAFGVNLLGFVLCFVGLYVTTQVTRLGALHMRFQLYQHFLARGGEPIPTKIHAEGLPSETRR
jgi:hypothetical protein